MCRKISKCVFRCIKFIRSECRFKATVQGSFPLSFLTYFYVVRKKEKLIGRQNNQQSKHNSNRMRQQQQHNEYQNTIEYTHTHK